MTRLTAAEREAFKQTAGQDMRQPDLGSEADQGCLTPHARLEYLRFASAAAAFFRGTRPLGFRGDDWRL